MASITISNKPPVKTSNIKNDTYTSVRINQILPFRVRFTAIGVEGILPPNVVPIPLQIIGYSNYIL